MYYRDCLPKLVVSSLENGTGSSFVRLQIETAAVVCGHEVSTFSELDNQKVDAEAPRVLPRDNLRFCLACLASARIFNMIRHESRMGTSD